MTRAQLIRSLSFTLLWSIAALGCGDAAVDATAEYATDSWAQPTDHGELVFGIPSEASFSAQQRFHAWTFALTDDASVDLTTQIFTTNLDTVMYLYHRQNAQSSWGRYIHKNDDHAGNHGSRIQEPLGAGEYLVQVKALKNTHYGTFRLSGACDGAGCPAQDLCAAGHQLPAVTSFTQSCADRIHALLDATVDWPVEEEIARQDACAYSESTAKAVHYAVQHWQQAGLWETGSEEGGSPQMQVLVHDRGSDGAVITVEHDASRLTFPFDGDSELLAVIDDGQWIAFTCGAPDEPSITSPSAACLDDAISGMSRSGDESFGYEGSGDLDAIELAGDPFLHEAYSHFAPEQSIGPDEPVAYEVESWESLFFDLGAYVTLTHEDAIATYALVETFNGMRIVSRADANGQQLLCLD